MRKPSVHYHFNSLEDYLSSKPLDVDGILDDGWGAVFPVKGREIDAAILFIDIAAFTERTRELNSTETLIFVNNFFAWITAEALRGRTGIIDKYIGDEMMVVFSEDFGSEDPFIEAVQTAADMAERDSLSFCPRIGIAAGRVTVGYVGTPMKYNCSVFGGPVSLAKRCCSVLPEESVGCSICYPNAARPDLSVESVFPPRKVKGPDNEIFEVERHWELLDVRSVELRNIGKVDLRHIVNRAFHLPSQSVEQRTRAAFAALKKQGAYHPVRYEFEPQWPVTAPPSDKS